MKFSFVTHKLLSGNLTRCHRAFTLVEMIVTVGVFSLVVMGVMYAQLFGLKVDQLTHSKLGASDQTRKSYDKFMLEIRSSKTCDVGNGTVRNDDTLTNFTWINDGSGQQGNAIRLYLTTATNNYILYYFDTNHSQSGKLTGELRRMHSGVAGSTLIVDFLQGTNMFFRKEDHRGNLSYDQSYKGVISVLLEFYQYQYPITRVGNGYYYDYYRTTFKLTPHVPDGA
jgi:prepilin-type N-terminal cleavage/methylation domain-containing protein